VGALSAYEKQTIGSETKIEILPRFTNTSSTINTLPYFIAFTKGESSHTTTPSDNEGDNVKL